MSMVKAVAGTLQAGGEAMIDAATNETKTPYKVQYPAHHWDPKWSFNLKSSTTKLEILHLIYVIKI